VTAPSAARQRFLLVHNPTAGVRRGRLVEDVVAALERRGATVIRAAPGEAGANGPLSAAGYDAVLAAGGDGTIRALSAAAGSLPIGIVPTGTGNVFATEIGLPWTAPAIAEVLIGGPVVEIEGARANGAPFFLMAGAGFDGEVVRRLDTGLKRRVGKLAYGTPILRALLTKPVELEVTIDGAKHSARWIVIANARHYGGSFVIAREAGVLKPGLQSVLFKSLGRVTNARQLLALAAGALARDSGVEIVSCRRVTVDAANPVPVQIDGDPFEPTPLVVEAGGPRVHVIVPPGFARAQSEQAP
jgi:diacylglycerol kinase family enzyme